MASGLLITAVLLFAVRGMFLGFTGVISKLISLFLAYVVAFSFRYQLAVFLSENTSITLPITALQIVSGVILFFGTLFLSGFVISWLFKSLGNVIPGFNSLLDKDSLGGKITGATVNGLIGAAIVLIGIWGYGKFSSSYNPDDTLHKVANRFGDTLFSVVANNADVGISSFSTSQSTSTYVKTDSKKGTATTSTGSAFIVSSSNPEKSLSIESIREVVESSGIDPNSLPIDTNSENMQALMNNTEVREKALEYLQENPQKIQEALNNPQLRQLLEQLTTSNE